MKVSTKIIIGSVLIIAFYHLDMVFTRAHSAGSDDKPDSLERKTVMPPKLPSLPRLPRFSSASIVDSFPEMITDASIARRMTERREHAPSPVSAVSLSPGAFSAVPLHRRKASLETMDLVVTSAGIGALPSAQKKDLDVSLLDIDEDDFELADMFKESN